MGSQGRLPRLRIAARIFSIVTRRGAGASIPATAFASSAGVIRIVVCPLAAILDAGFFLTMIAIPYFTVTLGGQGRQGAAPRLLISG